MTTSLLRETTVLRVGEGSLGGLRKFLEKGVIMKDRYYFSHDYNARNDGKLLCLRMRCGLEGLGCFWCIVEMLYEEEGYLRRDDFERIAFELRCEAELVRCVVLDFGLFAWKGDYFYSASVLKRLALRREKSEQARRAVAARWAKGKSGGMQKRGVGEPSLFENGTGGMKGEPAGVDDMADVPPHVAEMLRRREGFYRSCLAYVPEYGERMVRDFFNFWSEANAARSKMRFEIERTWELKRRMALWAGRCRRGDVPRDGGGFRIGQRLMPDDRERERVLEKIGF